ncbi:MAG: MBL fold metallo-hydrolase [Flavobacteriaceae bacterium]|nr:MBL fold metallo-hydrolase [Flavobacteriaceae bacterium]
MKLPLTVTFLGTGTSQGIPVIGSLHPVCLSNDAKDKRLRVSVLLQWGNYQYVIDCGPDFRQQMLRENVHYLNGVLLTHEHNDHVAGIDDIRPFNFKQGELPFYAEKRVFDALKQRFSYVFETVNKYPGAPTIKEVVITKERSFELGGKMITPVEAMHANLPVLGFRIDDFAYMTDVKTISEAEKQKLKGLKVLVVNALREQPHESHLNLEEAFQLIDELKPETTYFTHISHLMGFHEEVEATLPNNVHLAYDTLKISL